MLFKRKSVKIVAALVVALLVLLFVYRVVLRKNGKEGFANDATTVTYFFLPQCPYCKDFQEEWKKFQEAAKPAGIATVEVDGSSPKNQKLVAEKKVSGYPTILVTKNGKDIAYEGDRTAVELLKFAKNPSA